MDILLLLVALLVGLGLSVYVLYRWWGRAAHKGNEAHNKWERTEQLLRDWQDSWADARPYSSQERVDLAQREE